MFLLTALLTAASFTSEHLGYARRERTAQPTTTSSPTLNIPTPEQIESLKSQALDAKNLFITHPDNSRQLQYSIVLERFRRTIRRADGSYLHAMGETRALSLYTGAPPRPGEPGHVVDDHTERAEQTGFVPPRNREPNPGNTDNPPSPSDTLLTQLQEINQDFRSGVRNQVDAWLRAAGKNPLPPYGQHQASPDVPPSTETLAAQIQKLTVALQSLKVEITKFMRQMRDQKVVLERQKAFYDLITRQDREQQEQLMPDEGKHHRPTEQPAIRIAYRDKAFHVDTLVSPMSQVVHAIEHVKDNTTSNEALSVFNKGMSQGRDVSSSGNMTIAYQGGKLFLDLNVVNGDITVTGHEGETHEKALNIHTTGCFVNEDDNLDLKQITVSAYQMLGCLDHLKKKEVHYFATNQTLSEELQTQTETLIKERDDYKKQCETYKKEVAKLEQKIKDQKEALDLVDGDIAIAVAQAKAETEERLTAEHNTDLQDLTTQLNAEKATLVASLRTTTDERSALLTRNGRLERRKRILDEEKQTQDTVIDGLRAEQGRLVVEHNDALQVLIDQKDREIADKEALLQQAQEAARAEQDRLIAEKDAAVANAQAAQEAVLTTAQEAAAETERLLQAERERLLTEKDVAVAEATAALLAAHQEQVRLMQAQIQDPMTPCLSRQS